MIRQCTRERILNGAQKSGSRHTQKSSFLKWSFLGMSAATFQRSVQNSLWHSQGQYCDNVKCMISDPRNTPCQQVCVVPALCCYCVLLLLLLCCSVLLFCAAVMRLSPSECLFHCLLLCSTPAEARAGTPSFSIGTADSDFASESLGVLLRDCVHSSFCAPRFACSFSCVWCVSLSCWHFSDYASQLLIRCLQVCSAGCL